MGFAPVAVASIPKLTGGGRLRGSISNENMALGTAVLAILESGNAAQSDQTFATRKAAGIEGRRVAKVCAKVKAALEGTSYRVRVFEEGQGFTFALFVGKAIAPRKSA